ncbi:MAG TPA: GAF domain-containing sensor histidine kinase [Terriglobales bacterium]
MPAPLPIKESARALIVESSTALQPYFAEINAAWRQRMFEEFQFEGRAMVALERLNFGAGFVLYSHSDFGTFTENLTYFGTRLARLRVDTRAVARSLEIFQELTQPHLEKAFGKRCLQAASALETLGSATYMAVTSAYFDAQQASTNALLQVLEAELQAKNLATLLERVLQITTDIFHASVGVILLLDPETQTLSVHSSVGFENPSGQEIAIAIGQGFTGRIAETGEPDMLADLSQSNGVLNPLLRDRAASLWGVPLKLNGAVTGVLIIGFEKPYSWLPTELELFRAIADRSALAIERAAITDALREREARIVELSGHLLKAQEEERKRISRELHDETGQALMVIRLYLGMLDGEVRTRAAKGRIQELLGVVDRTIEGIRRIIGRLSPLVLQELGLIAAIRKEAKDLARNAGVMTRVAIGDDVGRLAPEVETAIYRVVQESLHNVAKHAQAHNVNIQMSRGKGQLRLQIDDDGVGLSATQQGTGPRRATFGMAGMRERISTLGGSMRVSSKKGHGTTISVTVPVSEDEDVDRTAVPIAIRRTTASAPASSTGTNN